MLNVVKINVLVTMKRTILSFLPAVVLICSQAIAQVVADKEQLAFYTADWTGERLEDGRPKVSAALLDRLRNISIEEAWGVLRAEGYHNQFASGWEMLHDAQPFTGRALTAQYIPLRPDMNQRILDHGHSKGMIGASNSWPIDMLQRGDVYVADAGGKVVDGTLIGDNLGNSIYSKSGTGVVFDAGARDLEGLSKIDGFNVYVRGFDPSYLQEMMLLQINVPIRVGTAIVMPGDAVLAKKEGVIFIPPHLLEKVVIQAEFIGLKDTFGHLRLKQGRYTPGQIDGRWSEEIKNDFLQWVDKNPELVPMSREELDDFLKNRTW